MIYLIEVDDRPSDVTVKFVEFLMEQMMKPRADQILPRGMPQNFPLA